MLVMPESLEKTLLCNKSDPAALFQARIRLVTTQKVVLLLFKILIIFTVVISGIWNDWYSFRIPT